jgi:hypothetical protein
MLLCFSRDARSSYSGELLRVVVPGIRAEGGWILEPFGLKRNSGLLQLLNLLELLVGGVPSAQKNCFPPRYRVPFRL